MIEIPVYSSVSARYSLDISLNGVVFTLRFDWNTRDEAWTMDIVDNTPADILTGVKLVPNYLLVKQYAMRPGMPEGDFYLLDTSTIKLDKIVTYDNFGDRYRLMFLTPDEVLAGGYI